MMDPAKTYEIFFNHGEVVEIRGFGLSGKNSAYEGYAVGQGIVFWYFNNPHAFGQAVDRLDTAGAKGIYFSLNPVIPDFLARSRNRLQAASSSDAIFCQEAVLRIHTCFAEKISGALKKQKGWPQKEAFCRGDAGMGCPHLGPRGHIHGLQDVRSLHSEFDPERL